MPKRIVREKEGCVSLACGKTKFRGDYTLRDPRDPFVPGTKIRRLRPLRLGPRNVGYLADELDALITALAALRDVPPKTRAAS